MECAVRRRESMLTEAKSRTAPPVRLAASHRILRPPRLSRRQYDIVPHFARRRQPEASV